MNKTANPYRRIPLKRIGAGVYRSRDGLFEFIREGGGSSGTRLGPTGWCVRALAGDYADADGRFEPLMLDNGLTWTPTLKDCVVRAYRLKWEMLRSGSLTYEQIDTAQANAR